MAASTKRETQRAKDVTRQSAVRLVVSRPRASACRAGQTSASASACRRWDPDGMDVRVLTESAPEQGRVFVVVDGEEARRLFRLPLCRACASSDKRSGGRGASNWARRASLPGGCSTKTRLV
jgi:hypothetical protein